MGRRIERILKEGRIRDLPKRSVSIVEPSTKLAEVYRLLDEESSVAVLVCEGPELLGIFTERDILNRTALEGVPETPIGELMNPVKASLTFDDRLADAIGIMNETGFRHVVLRDKTQERPGLIGGRDILTLIADYYPDALLNLPPELHQRMTRPEGG